jgi:hypothetical protein
LHDRVAALQDRPKRQERDLEAGRGDGRIAFIQDSPAAGAHLFDAVDMRLGMDGAEPFDVGGLGFDGVQEILEGREGTEIFGELGKRISGDEFGLVESGVDSADAVGPLGMAGTSVVVNKSWAGGEANHITPLRCA